ncbi:iron-containing alcohol dehydrogenase [Roseococcus sp. SDR]|uniref:iron-containing alcohol dehydrogenase n=1 Tax=Roseococcus sp. SDR TaxID=2835532 RepID=UPI001BD090F4|nr:iron-containing alcohol dehydrogenase [Roseococcus sp. SDR]MBS7789449.1 iron-containing alcohol dehydrogenase [Roseococcus sp. SDR]MBV1844763.1 iron-containing alcohol dehydrogenase [Roseococcus sp. SDR]
MSALLHPIEIARPARLEFGAGLARRLGAWAREQGITRTLVVSGRSNAARVDLLELPGRVEVFAQVKPEPDIPNLKAALAMAEAVGAELVVGFGGGSAMDLAKLVAVLPSSGQTIHEVVGPEKVLGRRVKLAQVATTAGTGSEAGTRALVTDPATQNKLAVQSRHMMADIAIVDPELMLSVPPDVTAATGVDALAHCAEAFTSKKAHPLIDLYVLEGIRLVGRYLPRAVRDGGDLEARAGLALASLYGGYGLGPVNTTAGHAVAYPLGTRHHVAHGLACAVIFPHTLAFNAPAVPEKTALVLEALGVRGAALEAAHGWCAALGIEMRLGQLGVPRDDLPRMATEAHAIRRLLDNNPRDLPREEILAMYEAAF